MTEAEHVSEVWIGLAEVQQRPGADMLMDRNEAIVNVLAAADREENFRRAVSQALDAIGFDLVELEDAEPLRERQLHYVVSPDLLALAGEVETTGAPRFGRFHTWRSEDGDDIE